MTSTKSIHELPEEAYLRLKQVLTYVPVSTSGWYAGVKEGIYPKSVSLSANTKAWRVSDIKELLRRIESGDLLKQEHPQ